MKALVKVFAPDGLPPIHALDGLPVVQANRVMIDADHETANLVLMGTIGGHQAPMSPDQLRALGHDALSVANRIDAAASRAASILIARSARRFSMGDVYRAEAVDADREALAYSLEGLSQQADTQVLVAHALRMLANALDHVAALNREQGVVRP